MADKKKPAKNKTNKAGQPSKADPAADGPGKTLRAAKSRRAVKKARAAAAGPTNPHASLSFLRLAPRKVRLIADHLRGQNVGEALALLKFTSQAAAAPLAKLVRSALANAEVKGGFDVDGLVIKTLTVDGGPKVRRFMPRAMGRAYRIEKRTSHVYVELGAASGARPS